MAKKKRRKRPTGYRTGAADDASGSVPTRTRSDRPVPPRRGAAARPRAESKERREAEPSRPTSLLSTLLGRRGPARRRAPSLQPPVAVTLARGISAVGRSPLLLVITFLAVLVLWLGLSGYGVVTSAGPRAMVRLIALPPLDTLLDFQFLVSGRIASPQQSVALLVGLVVVRAALRSLWGSVILDTLRTPPEPAERGSSFRRAARSLVAMIGIQLGFMTFTTAAAFLIGSFIGPLGVLLSLVVGLYLFSYAPVVAVAEGVGTIRAAQLSIRAARVPGPQHVLFVMTYLALTLVVESFAPASRVAQATPSVGVWAFGLFIGFLHVSVLGALMYRWLLIRDHALEAAGSRRPSGK